MEYKIVHAAERKAFDAAITQAIRKADRCGSEGYVDLVNAVERSWETAGPKRPTIV